MMGLRDSEKLVGSVAYRPTGVEIGAQQRANWWLEGRRHKMDIMKGYSHW